jgi:hypothetical protein
MGWHVGADVVMKRKKVADHQRNPFMGTKRDDMLKPFQLPDFLRPERLPKYPPGDKRNGEAK